MNDGNEFCSRWCLTSVAPASMARRQPWDGELIENDSRSKCFQKRKKMDSGGEIWKWFFFSYWRSLCGFYPAASDGTGSRDCFRITNSSYEYVKWLNRENEVQMLREGERGMKTRIRLQFYHLFTNFTADSIEKWPCCKVLEGFPWFFFLMHLSHRCASFDYCRCFLVECVLHKGARDAAVYFLLEDFSNNFLALNAGHSKWFLLHFSKHWFNKRLIFK